METPEKFLYLAPQSFTTNVVKTLDKTIPIITNLKNNKMTQNGKIQGLPKNYAKTVAKVFGVSESLVYKVQGGERNNFEIRQTLVEMAKIQREKNEKKRNKLINQL